MSKPKFTLSQLRKSKAWHMNTNLAPKKQQGPKNKAKNRDLKADLFLKIIKTRFDVEIVKELKFDPNRKWRFDFAIPDHKIAIEVEGGVWTHGRHTRGSGFVKDMEKYNRAADLGWRLVRVVPRELLSSEFLGLVENMINKNNDASKS